MAIPGLPQGARRRVYKRVIDQLVTDPTLNNVVKHWITGVASIDGRKAPACVSTETSITLSPTFGPGRRYSPDAWLFPLTINVELRIDGSGINAPDMLDAMDLWEAIETAIYPLGDRDKELAFEADLVGKGAETGQVDFAASGFAGSEGESGVFRGSMTINVLRILAP